MAMETQKSSLWSRLLLTAGIAGVIATSGVVGAEMGVWLWLFWIPYYHLMKLDAQHHLADFKHGIYVIPDHLQNLGPLLINEDSGDAIVHSSVTLLVFVCLMGLCIGGWRWCRGMFWFWAPIIMLPAYSVMLGMHHTYPGGANRYIQDYYVLEGCDPPSYECKYRLGNRRPLW